MRTEDEQNNCLGAVIVLAILAVLAVWQIMRDCGHIPC